MKKIIEKLRAAESQEELAKRHARAQEGKANYNAYLKANEKILERGAKHVNQERRKFLDMLAKTGVSTSILKASSLAGGIFATRQAMAAGGPKRVFYCYIDSGAATGAWMPSSATNMNTVTRAYGPQGTNVASICHFRQVDVRLAGHSAAHQALGTTQFGVPTMDTRIAPLVSATTPYKAMYLGFDATTNGALCSNIGPCIDDPVAAYNRYFNSALPEGSTDDTYLKVFASQKKALQALRNKLSQEERERLDVHAEALSGLENRLTALMSGEGPDIEAYRPTLPSPSSYANRIVAGGKVQADIIIAALQAGLTNLAVLQLGNHQGTWRGFGTNYQGNLHDAAHSAPGAGAFNEMIGHISEVPAYIIKRLMETEGSDGQKLIDTTVFVQVTCMGNGMTHDSGGAPFIVATRMPGFRQGFSASAGGGTEDLNGAIPKGLGLPAGSYAAMGSSTLGLV
jgi:hypothetical protein